jgi:hypothetical protein
MKTASILLSAAAFALAAPAFAERPPRNDPAHLKEGGPGPAPKPFFPGGPAVAGATGPSVQIPATVAFSNPPVQTIFVELRPGSPEHKLILGPVDPKAPYGPVKVALAAENSISISNTTVKMILKTVDELDVDLNGNGTIEPGEKFKPAKIAGVGDKVFGPLRLQLKLPTANAGTTRNEPYVFYVSAVAEPKTTYALHLIPGCGRTATVGGAQFLIVDENVNGRYGEVGTDSVIIGGKSSTRLAPVMMVGSKIFHIEVAQDGLEVRSEEFKAETQKADVASGFKGTGKIVKFLVTGGGFSFDLAQSSAMIPGTYALVDARVQGGGEDVKVERGTFPLIEITKEKPYTVEWGKPSLDFMASKTLAGISISGVSVRGSQGEIYTIPDAKPPVISITGPRSETKPMTKGVAGAFSYIWDPGVAGKYNVTVTWTSGVFGVVSKSQQVE